MNLAASIRLSKLVGVLSSFTMLFSAAKAQLPSPTYGWNLGNSMEAIPNPGSWGPLPTQALINAVANARFNTVRIPCAWNAHADQSTYQIDPNYMAQVKQAVDWCYARNLYVIVNDHWDGGWLENNLTGTFNPTINAKMKAYWTQIAAAFSGYDNHLLFAAANEPNVDTAAQMSELAKYYQTFVSAVRSAKGNDASRWLVVQGPSTDIDKTNNLMASLPIDTVKGRLMVEVHYYTPYQYTIMSSDQPWGQVFYFWGQGYHSATDSYRNSTYGEESSLDAEFQKMYSQFTSRGIPVLLGEFRAAKRTNLNASESALNYASTTYWDKYVVDSAESHGMYPVCWDTPGQTFDWVTGAIQDRQTLASLTGGPSLPPPGGDGAQYCFELGAQGWATSGAPISGVATSNAQKYAGQQSLAVSFNGSAGTSSVYVPSPSTPAGKTISFRMWIPAGSAVSWIQPYVLDHNWDWSGTWTPIGKLKLNSWNVVTVAVPSNAVTPLQQLGVQFSTSASWAGTCYVDSVGWNSAASGIAMGATP